MRTSDIIANCLQCLILGCMLDYYIRSHCDATRLLAFLDAQSKLTWIYLIIVFIGTCIVLVPGFIDAFDWIPERFRIDGIPIKFIVSIPIAIVGAGYILIAVESYARSKQATCEKR